MGWKYGSGIDLEVGNWFDCCINNMFICRCSDAAVASNGGSNDSLGVIVFGRGGRDIFLIASK